MTPEEYFSFNKSVSKKRYDALFAFFVHRQPAVHVATSYGYTLTSFYSLVRDFRKHLKYNPQEDFFFKETTLGRKPGRDDELKELIIDLRKQYYSAEDIVAMVNAMSFDASYGFVYQTLREAGFARLPRRSGLIKKQLEAPLAEKAPVTEKLS